MLDDIICRIICQSYNATSSIIIVFIRYDCVDKQRLFRYNYKKSSEWRYILMQKRDTLFGTECSMSVNNTTVQFLLNKNGSVDTMNDLQEQLIRCNLHTHAHGEFFICHHASIQINLEYMTLTLMEGDIFYIPPNIPHVCITANTDKRFIVFGIRFLSKNLSNFQQYLSPFMDTPQPQILRSKSELVSTWEALLYDSARAEPELLALEMLTLLTRTAQYEFSAVPMPSAKDNPEMPEQFTRIAELEHIIYSQFMMHLTRSNIAEKLFISTRHLDRICKKRFGKTFHEQITECRLAAAVQILLDTDQTVEEVSCQVGFPSKSRFYQAFTNKFGTSPHQFRKFHSNFKSKF